jgi:predicted membrane protein
VKPKRGAFRIERYIKRGTTSMDSVFLFIMILFTLPWIITTIIMTPIQYRYIKKMEELKKQKQLSQSEMYEEMPVQEEILHMNLQSNILFIPANIIAGLIYKYRDR